MDKLRSVLEDKGIFLKNQSWDILKTKLTYKTLEKGEYIKRIDEVEQNIHFIKEGIVEYFELDKGNKRQTIYLSSTNDFVSVLESYLTQTPFSRGIITHTKTKLLSISFDEITKLCHTNVDFANLRRSLVEIKYLQRINREIDLLTKTAEERYKELLVNKPDLVLKLPQSIISSYLGIKPQSLSRIRSQIKDATKY